jgi:hypothetical protein
MEATALEDEMVMAEWGSCAAGGGTYNGLLATLRILGFLGNRATSRRLTPEFSACQAVRVLRILRMPSRAGSPNSPPVRVMGL